MSSTCEKLLPVLILHVLSKRQHQAGAQMQCSDRIRMPPGKSHSFREHMSFHLGTPINTKQTKTLTLLIKVQ